MFPWFLVVTGRKQCRVSVPKVLGFCFKNWWWVQARVQSQILGRYQKIAITRELLARLASTGRPCIEQQTPKKHLVLVRLVGILRTGIWWRCPHPHEGEGSPKGEPVWLWLAGQGRGVPAQCVVG